MRMLIVHILITIVAFAGADSAPASKCHTRAKLHHGKVIVPKCAPRKIRKAIKAANGIRHKPYLYGGGHSLGRSSGYDCSGAVSYVLRRAKLLEAPRASGAFTYWRRGGKGKWLTVYANSGHAFMVIAGRRFESSGYGRGPSWRTDWKPLGAYVARHPRRL